MPPTKQANPKSRIAQKILAAEATELCHGGEIAILFETNLFELRPDQASPGAAEGLNQALAATSVFYITDLAELVTPEVITALDGAASSSTKYKSAIPSMLTRLRREAVVGQHLEKAVLASGLVSSKSASASFWCFHGCQADSLADPLAQARKAIEAGTIQVNGQKIPPKSHQRMVGEGDLLDGRLLVLKAGKSAHKAILVE